jgi:hypothetical protein
MKKKLQIALLVAVSFVAGAAFMYWALYGWLFTKLIEAIERITV